MANTNGGTILLGIGERNSQFFIEGLEKPEQCKKKVWDLVNNRGNISVNLLHETNVFFVSFGEKIVLAIQVPRASRRQRPVYVGMNPLLGTYRRNYEGDYHCVPDEVGRMLADQAEEPADSRIMEGYSIDDLDVVSLQQYRQQFSARSPSPHPPLICG